MASLSTCHLGLWLGWQILLNLVKHILANLSGGKQTDVIFMDFAKVFDKVPHHRLIQKLERYGIIGPVNTWVEKFLNDRKQRM